MFLESKGALARKNCFPDEPEDERVMAYEEHGLMGPDLDAPRISLKQTFKAKWNKEVVEILTTQFVLAIKQGIYNSVESTWSQMNVENVRKRCHSKLYRSQKICLKRRKDPESDKINRRKQRRQEVKNFSLGEARRSLTVSRRTTEDRKSAI